MAKITTNQIAEAIYLSTKGKSGSELDTTIAQAVALIASKKMMSKSKDILNKLEELQDKDDGIAKIKITSADKLSKAIKDDLEESLKKRYKAKDIILEIEEDKSLLGGIKIRKGDEVIDLTLRNKVKQLQEHLIRN